jgi:flagellar basal-body rod protein FlgF
MALALAASRQSGASGAAMDNASTIALSRLVAQARQMDVSATNIANAGTPGYRGERTLFSDFLVRESGRALPPGEGALAYTQDRATYRDQQAGTLTHTANPLDLAISGDGFFTVQTAAGPRLTRAGHFELTADGTIADENGNALLDTAGRPLRIATADTVLTVAENGTLKSENGEIGRIALVVPADPMKLQAEGGRLFDATATTTAPSASAKIAQGAVEESNIQPTMEVTRMMTQLREFQFVTQFVQAESDRLSGAIDKILQKRG